MNESLSVRFECSLHKVRLRPKEGEGPYLVPTESGDWTFDLSDMRCQEEPISGQSCWNYWEVQAL